MLEYKFPGHPAPPLGLMFKICSSIESWLDADERNVAIVHCLTGKGRTAVVLACALTWIGEFNSPMEALTYIAERKNSSIDILTIPSQRRYIQYFSNVLDGVRPRGEPLLLRRIIMNGIPKYGAKADNNSNEVVGCCPYIQLFKNGKIIANGLIASGPSQDTGGEDNPVRWVTCSEESISFQIDCVVQGDLLLRCRHHDPTSGARISMFRAAFHTGYVPSGVLRLTKAQLDGPNHDDRYSNDFYIDLIFAPVEKADQVSNHTGSLSDAGTNLDHTVADKFEQMFHRDTRFWETISARKLKTKRRKSRKFQSELSEKFSILDDGKHKKHSDFELDDGDEIHFSESAPSTVLSSDIFLSGPSTLGTSELSDDELIKQLAEAAENVDLDYSSEKSNTNTNETTLQTTIKENQQSEVLQFDIKQSVVDSSQTLLNLPTTSARAELQALEDLEKELGLDLGSSAVSTIPSNISSSNKQDDNLDDLEDFLESLNK